MQRAIRHGIGATTIVAIVVSAIMPGLAMAGAAPSHGTPGPAGDAVAGADPRLTLIGDLSAATTNVAGMTPDGSHVFVYTPSTLTPGDPPGDHLYDIYAGQNRVISAQGSPRARVWSDGGSAVVFDTSKALTTDDTDTLNDIYVSIDGVIHLVSKGTNLAQMSAKAVASDGSAVIFATNEELTPDATELGGLLRSDLFRWDLASDQLTLLTPNTQDDTAFAGGTDDLGRVLIRSDTNLESGGTGPLSASYERVGDGWVMRTDTGALRIGPNMSWVDFGTNESWAPEDTDGVADTYRWNSAADTYTLLTTGTATASGIGLVSANGSSWIELTADALDPADQDGTDDYYLIRPNQDPLFLTGNGPLGSFGVSGNADLSTLTFSTPLPLLPSDTDGAVDHYLVRTDDLAHPMELTGPAAGVDGYQPVYAVSDDGNRVVFGSGEALVPEDTNNVIDLYAWEPGKVTLLTPNQMHTVLDAVIPANASRVAYRTSALHWYLVDFDVIAPHPSIAGPALSRGSANLLLSTDGAERTSCVLDGIDTGSCSSPWFPTGLAEGGHSATIKAWDTTGNLGTATWTWEADTTAPTAGAPVPSLDVGQSVGTSTVPITLRWTGTDANGVVGTTIEKAVDGLRWTRVAASLAAFETVRSLAPGHTYRFRVTTWDRAGNRSARTAGAPFQLGAAQEGSPSITYSGTWATSSSSSAMGGHLRFASSSGARATYHFSGKSLWWVTTTSPTRGSAQVWVDGTYRTTVALYSLTTINRRTMYQVSWPTAGTHTVQIRVIGTGPHPRVDVDAFIVMS